MPSAKKGLHQSERQFRELECSASSGFTWKRALLVTLCLLLNGCGSRPANVGPSIEFTRVPQADAAGLDKLDIIQGRVTGAHPGQQIVLDTRSGKWWVQPRSNAPFTKIQPDSNWINSIHLGSEYAALLVEPGYQPPAMTNELPTRGGAVVATALAQGETATVSPTLNFSGYEWRVTLPAIAAAGRITTIRRTPGSIRAGRCICGSRKSPINGRAPK